MNYKALVEFKLGSRSVLKGEVFDASEFDSLSETEKSYLKNMKSPRFVETDDDIYRPDVPKPLGELKFYKTLVEVGVHESDNLPIGTDINNTDISTGFDLSIPGAEVRMSIKDTGAAGRSWGVYTIKTDDLEADKEAGTFSFKAIYDNDHLRVLVKDLENGVVNFVDVGRQFAYLRSELWAPAIIRGQLLTP